MTDKPTRRYSSPLRENQARQTQDLILDALTDLLADRRADEITIREIAGLAGVSQPTVYRHFPDREALLTGLGARLADRMSPAARPPEQLELEDFGPTIEAFFTESEEFVVESRAEALLNADPRNFSAGTRRVSDQLARSVAAAFPDLDEPIRIQFTGLLRSLGSAQTWLRMREEFGVPGTESGPLVAWAVECLIEQARAGIPTTT